MANWISAEPASSLAAQLAPHFASQGDQSQLLTRETFSQLRQELVGGRYSQLQFDDNDTDVNKLICIVLKASLEFATKDGKQTTEDLEGQTLDCLDIIHAAVEKTPQALIQVSDPGILGESIRAPLFAWLVVRLIGLVGTWDSDAIREAACNTLSTLVNPQSKQGRSMLFCHSVSSLSRACTMGS